MNPLEKKNILIITDVFGGMAGSERNIIQLLTHIDGKKFKLYLASIYSGKLSREMLAQGHSIIELRPGSIFLPSGLRNIVFLRRLIREKKISLIVTYHESSDFYGFLLAKLCNLPVISNRRDMGFKTRGHYRMAYRFVGSFFDKVITVCEAVKDEVIKKGWFPAGRILALHNGVDLRAYGTDAAGNRKKLGIPADRPVVGLVANIRKIKGIRYFLEAAALICKKHPDADFIIIGGCLREPGSTQEDMLALVRQLNIEKNVHFYGNRTDTAEIISVFDVAVLASLSEGFSNTLIEYMASAKPVVATRVGGNPEAVCHGETGFLVPAADSQALAKAILSLLEDKEQARQFGLAGRKRVEEHFALERMIKNYEDVFDAVINARAGKNSHGVYE